MLKQWLHRMRGHATTAELRAHRSGRGIAPPGGDLATRTERDGAARVGNGVVRAATAPVPSLAVSGPSQVVRVGVLGCGNVGAALVELIGRQAKVIESRTGLRLEVARVAVRNLARERDVDLPPGLLTRDSHALVEDPEIDVVVEVIGGIEPARELILTALRHGKPVVTANKELLANVGTELFSAADEAGQDLLFEAAVAGGIPLIRALRESLRGEPLRRVLGIVNGTTNYILTKMSDGGATYGEALSEAQRLGYAERDPTADVEGLDAGAKAAIIASIAFGARVVAGDVYHEGISKVTAADIASAHPPRLRRQAPGHLRAGSR